MNASGRSCAERQRLGAELAKVEGIHPPTPQESRIAAATRAILAMIVARVRGEQEPTAAPVDPVTIHERVAACDKAIEEHDRKTRSLEIKIAAELYESDFAETHRQAHRRIVEAALELKAAFDDELKLAYQIFQAGALTEMHNRLWLNLSACAQLRTLLTGMNATAFRQCNANLLKS